MTRDVLASDPVLRYIQFPEPMAGNLCRYLETPAWAVRDVICSNGFVKFIEIEERNRLVIPAAPSNDLRMSVAENAMVCTPESIFDGWTAVTWNRKTADHCSKDWIRDCRADVNKRSILTLLRHNHWKAWKSQALTGVCTERMFATLWASRQLWRTKMLGRWQLI